MAYKKVEKLAVVSEPTRVFGVVPVVETHTFTNGYVSWQQNVVVPRPVESVVNLPQVRMVTTYEPYDSIYEEGSDFAQRYDVKLTVEHNRRQET